MEEREKRERQSHQVGDREASFLQTSSLITQVSNAVNYTNTLNSQIFNKNTVGTWPPTHLGALYVSGFPETGVVKIDCL